jgi:hypothetical protein
VPFFYSASGYVVLFGRFVKFKHLGQDPKYSRAFHKNQRLTGGGFTLSSLRLTLSPINRKFKKLSNNSTLTLIILVAVCVALHYSRFSTPEKAVEIAS